MPLFNLAWKREFFWDGRASSLRQQVLMPIQDGKEMHEPLEELVGKLAAAPGYADQFEKAFGSREINADRVARALEQFVLTLESSDSKFDRALKGRVELSEEEKHGFELFMTEYDPQRGFTGADCFHCHGGPLFSDFRFTNNGLDADPSDTGRERVTGNALDKGKFAVPSLRDVALTAPYMHDGRFQTLEEVIDHYCIGTKRSETLDPNLAKHPDGGVPLSVNDKKALVAFLRTL
jgi:cytochrome c peroxidase